MVDKTPLHIEIDSSDATTVQVTLSGDLDFDTASELASVSLGEGFERVDVDLSGVEFIDSSGIAALVRLYQRAAAEDAVLRVVAVTPYLRSLLRMTALDRLFSLPPS
ncbi:STAS domain-containing protein [Nonomuraea sp. NPDC048826]|uniref:STAS domain-containing protein n=1 Tax=Nonomuraea sp. NPDC048826 TaxID=3364347 RepID=UPI0037216324